MTGVAMYCSSCGSAVKSTLSYCNHCGAKLRGAKGDSVTRPAEVSPETLVPAIVALFVLGLGAIIGLVVEGVFIWMLLSRRRGAQEVSDAERLRDQAAKELGAAPGRALPEPEPSV